MTTLYPPVTDPRLFDLKDLQSQRLRTTYDDFAKQPAYEPACFFFFNRLYTTENTEGRDAAFRKVHAMVNQWLGGEVVRSMDKLIELQELTLQLDQAMVEGLNARKAPIPCDLPTYEAVYASCDNYKDRLTQISLLEYTMRLIHRISHRFGIGLVLSGLHAGCVLVGETRLVDFLMDGYKAFKNLRRIEPLSEAMVYRETERLNRIYGRPYTDVF